MTIKTKPEEEREDLESLFYLLLKPAMWEPFHPSLLFPPDTKQHILSCGHLEQSSIRSSSLLLFYSGWILIQNCPNQHMVSCWISVAVFYLVLFSPVFLQWLDPLSELYTMQPSHGSIPSFSGLPTMIRILKPQCNGLSPTPL